MQKNELVEIPNSVKDIFQIPYDEVTKRYTQRQNLLKSREQGFNEFKQGELQRLEKLLEKYISPANHVAEVVESRIRSIIRGMAIKSIGHGSPQSRYANKIREDLETLLQQREEAVDSLQVRQNISRGIKALYGQIQPNYLMSTDTFVVDLGLKQTAAVVTIDSLARGRDEQGRPIGGELYMNGYSINDLIAHTDFIGSVGIMLKQKPLSPEEHNKLSAYMCSKTLLTDKEKQIIDMNIENLSYSNPVFDAKIIMKIINQVMLYSSGSLGYANLEDLNLKATKEMSADKIKAKKDDVFYTIADQGIALGAKVMISTAYALRSMMKKEEIEIADMPNEADPSLSWGGNFLRFLYGSTEGAHFNEKAKAMDDYFQLIRTHGAGNASSFSTRVAGGAFADTASALSSGNNALSGDRHGFANYLVHTQVEPIYNRLRETSNGNITDVMMREEIDKVWEKEGQFFGIGHAVYNNDPERMLPGDPRAGVMVDMIRSWNIPELNNKLDFYLRWEEHAVAKLEKEKGIKNNFAANVDFLTGFLLQDRVNLPVEANTVMFEVGRVFGHLTHYMESLQAGIIRSKALYLGDKGLDLTEN